MKRVDDGCCMMANEEENDEVDGGCQEIIQKQKPTLDDCTCV